MQLFLKDRVGVNSFKLGLEIAQHMSAAVGATTVVGEIVAVVLRLFTLTSPAIVSSRADVIERQTPYQLPLPPPCFFTLLGSASA